MAPENKRTFSPRYEQLRNFINERCIKRVPQGSKEMPAKLPEIGYYVWQFYLRAAVLKPEFLAYIAGRFWASFHERYLVEPFQLTGVEQASLPIITALLISAANKGLPVTAFTIRKDYKTYGIGNIIEGEPSNLPVVFVDDLTSPQHSTFWHATRVLSRERLRLYPYAFVLVRKQHDADSPVIPTSMGDVTVEGIFTMDDFGLKLA